jgi:hypothetical protein
VESGMSVPKSHHYVPKLILRRFADERGHLYFFRKDRPGAEVKSASLDRLFAAEHLYSKKRKDGSKDPALEHGLNRLETEVAPVFSQIIEAARNGRPPGLSAEQKEVVALFHYVQWKRSFDHRLTFLSNEVFSTIYDQAAERAREMFPGREEEIERIRAILLAKEHIHNVRVDMLRLINPDTLDLLMSRALVVAVPQNRLKSWIIGSSPVIKLGSADLTHPDSEIWLPIAPDVAIGFWRVAEPERVLWMPDIAVRHMNGSVASQSIMFAGRSKELVQSLSRPR